MCSLLASKHVGGFCQNFHKDPAHEPASGTFSPWRRDRDAPAPLSQAAPCLCSLLARTSLAMPRPRPSPPPPPPPHNNTLSLAHPLPLPLPACSFNMIEAARQANVQRFFYASSACIYPEYKQVGGGWRSCRGVHVWDSGGQLKEKGPRPPACAQSISSSRCVSAQSA